MKKIRIKFRSQCSVNYEREEYLESIKSIEMHNVCIVSSFVVLDNKDKIDDNFISTFSNKEKNVEVFVYKTKYEKCLRCWQYKKEVSINKGLCERCLLVLNNSR